MMPFLRILFPALLLLLAGGGTVSGKPMAAAGGAKSPPPASGEVKIRLTFPDGTPAAGAEVTAGGKRYSADGRGAVALPGIPATEGVVSGTAARLEGGFLGFFRKSVRYAAFHPVAPVAGDPLDLRLGLERVSDMDLSCRSCHPDQATPAHRIVRCAHKSGVPLKAALEGRVRQFNQENETLRREGKPFHPAIVLEKRRVGGWIFGETKGFLACESCHTNHVETGQRAYVTMPFDEQSILCRGCHV